MVWVETPQARATSLIVIFERAGVAIKDLKSIVPVDFPLFIACRTLALSTL
jgi:hypothetical protein